VLQVENAATLTQAGCGGARIGIAVIGYASKPGKARASPPSRPQS